MSRAFARPRRNPPRPAAARPRHRVLATSSTVSNSRKPPRENPRRCPRSPRGPPGPAALPPPGVPAPRHCRRRWRREWRWTSGWLKRFHCLSTLHESRCCAGAGQFPAGMRGNESLRLWLRLRCPPSWTPAGSAVAPKNSPPCSSPRCRSASPTMACAPCSFSSWSKTAGDERSWVSTPGSRRRSTAPYTMSVYLLDPGRVHRRQLHRCPQGHAHRERHCHRQRPLLPWPSIPRPPSSPGWCSNHDRHRAPQAESQHDGRQQLFADRPAAQRRVLQRLHGHRPRGLPQWPPW